MSSDHGRKRKYELKARAQRQRDTRERIVAATVKLHETVGPARTTIAEIARLARVQRLTVYNAFPDTRDLFRACQGRFLAEHPLPDLRPSGPDAGSGFERSLSALYRWYRSTADMEHYVHRDRHLVPALDELMAATGDAAFSRTAAVHARALSGGKPSREMTALVRLAFEFRTWELLAGQGLTDARIAALMKAAVRAANGSRR